LPETLTFVPQDRADVVARLIMILVRRAIRRLALVVDPRR
jgi:hypothetical protein